MKRNILLLVLILCLGLIVFKVFAANGDLIVNGNVGIGTNNPGQKLSVAGTVESTSGGIKFPDGTLQATAYGARNYASTTVTAAGTTTLNVNSYYIQLFTGSTTQTVVLPDVSTLTAGWSVIINNQSTGIVTVKTSGGNVIQAMGNNSVLTLIYINAASGIGPNSWTWNYTATGTFYATATGFSGTAPTTTGRYTLTNNSVTLEIDLFAGTSNSASLTLTGLPSVIYPARNQYFVLPFIENNGASTVGTASLSSSGTIVFGAGIAGTAFTTSGQKGIITGITLVYNLL